MPRRHLFILINAYLLCSCLALAGLDWESTEQVVPCPLGVASIEAVYPFTNTGDEAVVILDIRHSCGCTTTDLKNTVFEPGEQGAITIRMDTKGMKGEQAKTVSIYTSASPDKPEILYLYTDIPVRFELKPAILAWPFRSNPEVRRASLRFHPDIPFSPERIRLVVKETDALGISFQTAVKKGAGPHELAIEVLPGSLGSMGHCTLEVTYLNDDTAEKIGDIYLVVN